MDALVSRRSCCLPALRRCRAALRGLWTAASGSPPPQEAAPAEADSGLWLIAGLGNVGAQYDGTRHNVGFAAVDALAARLNVPIQSVQHRALTARARLGAVPLLLCKPSTMMNASGAAVARLARFYRVPPARLLVLYDDLDTEVAVLRLRKQGGHGGHNGVRSIIDCLGGARDFPRLRIGIGRPPGSQSVSDHVLSRFGRGEAQAVEGAVARAVAAVEDVLSRGVDAAMNSLGVAEKSGGGGGGAAAAARGGAAAGGGGAAAAAQQQRAR